jgi:H+/Cl- antiporter ClcA
MRLFTTRRYACDFRPCRAVEGTGGISFVFSIIVAVVVSNAVSSWFTHHGVYHLSLERNNTVSRLPTNRPLSDS